MSGGPGPSPHGVGQDARVGVVVVDDHPVVLAGLRALLGAAPDLEVVATAGSAAAARDLPADLGPDVCVVDLRLPDGDGVALAVELKQRWPHARALVLTLTCDDAEVVRSLGAGLDGYVLKDSAPPELVAAVRSVAHGSTVIGRGARPPAARAAAWTPGAALARLDARDREILELLAAGLGVVGVAGRLYLAPKTVRNRITDLVRKLEVEDREAAVALLRDAGRRGPPVA